MLEQKITDKTQIREGEFYKLIYRHNTGVTTLIVRAESNPFQLTEAIRKEGGGRIGDWVFKDRLFLFNGAPTLAQFSPCPRYVPLLTLGLQDSKRFQENGIFFIPRGELILPPQHAEFVAKLQGWGFLRPIESFYTSGSKKKKITAEMN